MGGVDRVLPTPRGFSEKLVQRFEDDRRHFFNVLVGVDDANDSRRLVVLEDRDSLGVEGREPGLESLSRVVWTLDQWLARHVVLHVAVCATLWCGLGEHAAGLQRLWRGVDDVVRATRWLVDPPASDAGFENVVRDIEAEDVRHALALGNEQSIQHLSLLERAGHPVENEPILAVVGLDSLLDDAKDNLVSDEGSRVHCSLCLETDWGLGRHCCPKHVASGQLRDVKCSLDLRPTCALASPRFAEKDHDLSWPELLERGLVGALNTVGLEVREPEEASPSGTNQAPHTTRGGGCTGCRRYGPGSSRSGCPSEHRTATHSGTNSEHCGRGK
eukprot:m.142738 g.142738  ORF g.142738 m.142738 type:complete len:330 (-) comp22941_c0_seq1:33-1022(-)